MIANLVKVNYCQMASNVWPYQRNGTLLVKADILTLIKVAKIGLIGLRFWEIGLRLWEIGL